jgi:hypothetical protein
MGTLPKKITQQEDRIVPMMTSHSEKRYMCSSLSL